MWKSRIYFLALAVFSIFFACKEEQKTEIEQSETIVKIFGGLGTDGANDVIEFGNGFALTGTMQTADNGKQAFLIATDEFGNELPWSPILFGGKLDDTGNKLFRQKSGDFIIVGTSVFSLTAPDSSNILVACISNSGVIKWQNTYGGSLKEEGYFGLETNDNNIVVGGYTESFGNGGKDVCMYKINNAGQVIWVSEIGGSLSDIGKDIIEIGPSLFIIGESKSYSSTMENELFVIKALNNNGKPQNFNHFGISGSDVSGLKIDTLSNSETLLLLAQNYRKSVDKSEIYVMQIKSDLYQTVWSKQITSNTSEIAADIVYSQTNIFIIGTKIQTSTSNAVFYKLNANGNTYFSDSIINSGNLVVNALVQSKNDKICFVGSNFLGTNSQIVLVSGVFK